MKILKLFILITVFILMFSCASTDNNNGTMQTADDEQKTADNEQTEKTEELSAGEEEEQIFITETDNEEETSSDDFAEDITEYIAQINEDAIPSQPEERPQITQTQPPEQEQRPPPVIPQPRPPAQVQPPAQTQPPAQMQPPQQVLPQVQPEPQIQETEEPAEDEIQEEEPPYARNNYLTNPDRFPSVPAARIESLTQEGSVPQNENIIYSRVVRVTVGQVLEIPFRGNGWVYLGELASRRGIAYNSRRTEPEGMSFIFNIEQAGTYSLKFFKEDFTRGYIINDHVQVIAGEAPDLTTGWFNPPYERGRIVAQPRWPSAIEEAQIQKGGNRVPDPSVRRTENLSLPLEEQKTQNGQQRTESDQRRTDSDQQRTVTEQPVTAPAPAAEIRTPSEHEAAPIPQTAVAEKQESPEKLLQKAKETFIDGNVAASIALLDQYTEYYPGGSDEAYWLYGQFYEANSPSRNILLSLDYYRRLVNEYPQSSRLTDARRRIAYLERFYINIQ